MQNSQPVSQPTKQQVYDIIKREIKKHLWAQDTQRLANMMIAVQSTLNGTRKCVLTGSFQTAWKEVGLKGKPTYKGLHSLPGAISDPELFPKGGQNVCA